MTVRSLAGFASMAAVAAYLPLGISSAGATSVGTAQLVGDTAVQPPQLQRVDWSEKRKVKLRIAYSLLEHADHEYDGHRLKAMEHIRKAGEIVGMDLHAKGSEVEPGHAESDDKMRRAKVLLKEVAEESGGKELERVREAIHEIDRGLERH